MTAEDRNAFLVAADLFDPPPSPKRLAWEGRNCPNYPRCMAYAIQQGVEHGRERLEPDCTRHARPKQLTPPGDWFVWYVQAGRGFGKSRVGAEDMAEYARTHPGSRLALVAETFADGRDTMVEGESGLLACLDGAELRGGNRDKAWNRSMGELYLANGAKFKIYSSEKPGQLRGPQHERAWCDELAKFRDAHKGAAEDTTWSNLLFGLRLGPDPRVIVTTTPKAYDLPRQVKKLPGVHLTRGSSYENLDNLAPAYRTTVIAQYEGTRLGRQELMAEDLDEAEGALWTHDPAKAQDKGLIVHAEPPIDERALRRVSEDTGKSLDALRGPEALYDRLGAADLLRVVIGVDPAVTSGPDADETGIIIGARASDGKAYILDDRTLRASPNEWAHRIVNSLDDFKADRIVPEVNNGGELVTTVIRTIRPTAPITAVHASKGKRTRAEPVSALYQQGRVFHVRPFPELEAQMTTWEPGSGEPSPDRMDALVWCLTELMKPGATGRVTSGPDIWG